MIFDVDGTLVDSNDAHAKAFEEALGIPFERVRPLIGMGADKLIPALIGRYDAALAERKKQIFRQRYLPRLRAFPQVKDLFQALKRKGARLAVASSAGKDELDALLEVAGVQPWLEAQTGAEDAERSKPDPDIVRAALAKLGMPARDCALVRGYALRRRSRRTRRPGVHRRALRRLGRRRPAPGCDGVGRSGGAASQNQRRV